MKVCVYAIAKNEEKFARRWLDSMSEADGIFVLDTGSADNTVALLKEGGARVEQKIFTPFRFDRARNASLEMVPQDTDVCVCTDLDEVFRHGWRAGLERAFAGGAEQVYYRYTWDFLPSGAPGHTFWLNNAHARRGFVWKHPVHEVICTADGRVPRSAFAPDVQLDHLADAGKSRAQYLPLLQLSVQEDPEDDRNAHYLGREYLFYGRYDEAIAELLRHLSLKKAVWKDERAASMRYIARSFKFKGDRAQAEIWYLRAVAEAPHLREPLVETAQFYLEEKNWHGACFFALKALAITRRSMSYISEPDAWGWAPYDCLAVALYYLGDKAGALQNARLALRAAPDNRRLQKNLEMIKGG